MGTPKKIKLLNVEPTGSSVWGLQEAWNVLGQCDWSGVVADEAVATGPVERKVSGKRKLVDVVNSAVAMHGAMTGGGLCAVKEAEQSKTATPTSSARRDALRKAASVLETAAAAIKANADVSKENVAKILEHQGKGRILTRRVVPDAPLPSLQGVLVLAEEERAYRVQQAGGLVWAALQRLLPKLNFPVFSLTSTCFEIGLQSWAPRYHVLKGAAETGTLRGGHPVSFTVPHLPAAWVEGHLLGAAVEGIDTAAPYTPVSIEPALTDALRFLQLTSSLSLLAESCKQYDFEAQVAPVEYPIAGMLTLLDPRTKKVCITAVVKGDTVRFEDPSTAEDVTCSVAGLVGDRSYFKTLQGKYL